MIGKNALLSNNMDKLKCEEFMYSFRILIKHFTESFNGNTKNKVCSYMFKDASKEHKLLYSNSRYTNMFLMDSINKQKHIKSVDALHYENNQMALSELMLNVLSVDKNIYGYFNDIIICVNNFKEPSTIKENLKDVVFKKIRKKIAQLKRKSITIDLDYNLTDHKDINIDQLNFIRLE